MKMSLSTNIWIRSFENLKSSGEVFASLTLNQKEHSCIDLIRHVIFHRQWKKVGFSSLALLASARWRQGSQLLKQAETNRCTKQIEHQLKINVLEGLCMRHCGGFKIDQVHLKAVTLLKEKMSRISGVTTSPLEKGKKNSEIFASIAIFTLISFFWKCI